ncbi:hypothetical protein KM043_003225 [Ampulex compressa]|nr:hypothetical protein KM043_003225 [Ampulex compressa]
MFDSSGNRTLCPAFILATLPIGPSFDKAALDTRGQIKRTPASIHRSPDLRELSSFVRVARSMEYRSDRRVTAGRRDSRGLFHRFLCNRRDEARGCMYVGKKLPEELGGVIRISTLRLLMMGEEIWQVKEVGPQDRSTEQYSD